MCSTSAVKRKASYERTRCGRLTRPKGRSAQPPWPRSAAQEPRKRPLGGSHSPVVRRGASRPSTRPLGGSLLLPGRARHPAQARCGHGSMPRTAAEADTALAAHRRRRRTRPMGRTPSGAPWPRTAARGGHGPWGGPLQGLPGRGPPQNFFYPTSFHRPNCIGLPPHLVRVLSLASSRPQGLDWRRVL